MLKLTPRQAEILAFIKRCLDDNGYPPTRAEIALELGFKSPNAAEEHLKALARKGAIEMTPGASRGIRIPGFEAKADESTLPIIGRVAAGAPILAQQHVEESCNINPTFFHPRADYLLRVHGMSMKDVGISTATCWPCTPPAKPATARSWWRGSATKSPSSASSAKAARSGCW